VKELIELARRVALSLERIALRLDLLTAAQASWVTQSVDLADVSLNPQGILPRTPVNVTMNSSTPLAIQISVRQDKDARFLDLWLFDAFGSVVWMTSLRAKTLSELQEQYGLGAPWGGRANG
jgi:hypothetical protein